MNRLLKFIIVGLVFAAVGEYLLSVIVRGDPINLLRASFYNILILIFVFYSSKLIDRNIKNERNANLIFFFVYGFMGLMVEWFVIGNSPWQNPSANQFGMFAYWSTLITMARISTMKGVLYQTLNRRLMKFFIIFTAVSVIGGHMLPIFEMRLFVMVWALVLGYGFMSLLILWNFLKRPSS